MSFLDPGKLGLLALVVALAVVYVVTQVRRSRYAVRFTNLDLLEQVAPRRPGWRRHAAALGFLMALIAMVVAFARPTRVENVPRERATVVLALDVSLSMAADDVPPTRLQALQRAAKSFLEAVPPKINVGLVSFDGNARLAVPPTTDRARVSAAIDRLQLGPGTAIGEAIYTSLDAIRLVDSATPAGTAPVPAAIVVMSDGKTTMGRPNAMAVAEATRASVPISTIAFGTDRGTIIDPQGGSIVAVPVDRPALRVIANSSGGTFFSATTEGELSSVYQRIGSSIGFEQVDKEITAWFVGAGIIALMATGAMSLAWFSRLP